MRIWHFLLAATITATIIHGGGEAGAADDGAHCGGVSKVRCDGALWCDPRPDRCASPQAPGRCVRVPEFCTLVYQPVCGCDGNTYANDCVRRSNRVGKRRDSAC